MVIAISGPAGSGKSTQAKMIAEALGLRYVSAGHVFRRIAEELGVDIVELSRIAEKDPRIDLEVDRRSREEALKGNVVVEGHLTAWVIRDLADVTIYLTAPLHVRVSRIAARDGKEFSEALAETLIREYSQIKRFRKFYGIDVRDLSLFDLVLNTEGLTVEETFNVILSFIKAKLKGLTSATRNT